MNTLSLCFFLVCFLFSSKESYGGRVNGGITKPNFHVVNVSSLLPSSVCSSSSKGHLGWNKKSSLPVVHRNGPCSHLNIEKSTHAQTLLQDQKRVDSIHTMISSGQAQQTMESTTLPAKAGQLIGSANYYVTIGLGEPKRDLSLIFDTGSSLTWTQCKPCRGICYSQIEPIFDPNTSSSYTNVLCTSPDCNALVSATRVTPACSSSSTCVYGSIYGDNSSSFGYLAKEKLTLTSTDTFDSFLFGCGQQNRGLFNGAAGLLGLGRDKLSFPSQTAAKYNKHFSYCLPSTPSSTGYLTFGDEESVSKTAKFTPMKTISGGETFYALDIIGISVGGQKLPISDTVFARGGSIIDSGTVITRLPPTVYSALSSAFRSVMKYPRAPSTPLLDTCYDLSNQQTVSIPKIAFFFGGGVEVDLEAAGVVRVYKPSQVCLAFAANGADSDLSIFGNAQQRTMEVVYDGAGSRVGFASGGCS